MFEEQLQFVYQDTRRYTFNDQLLVTLNQVQGVAKKNLDKNQLGSWRMPRDSKNPEKESFEMMAAKWLHCSGFVMQVLQVQWVLAGTVYKYLSISLTDDQKRSHVVSTARVLWRLFDGKYDGGQVTSYWRRPLMHRLVFHVRLSRSALWTSNSCVSCQSASPIDWGTLIRRGFAIRRICCFRHRRRRGTANNDRGRPSISGVPLWLGKTWCNSLVDHVWVIPSCGPESQIGCRVEWRKSFHEKLEVKASD